MSKPHFVIKNKFQRKRELYEDLLTADILKDVCFKITGRKDFTVDFDNSGYNIGRLATLKYQKITTFISFSETNVTSRNSSFQSFPSALVRYHEETNVNKKICFYFLPSSGSIETSYFRFMYRLMKTAGTEFLNASEHLNHNIVPFNSPLDIIAHRNDNRRKNRSNNSTYLTIDEDNTIQLFGKTYGANKYETTLLCLALSEITTTQIELYEIREGNLTILPGPARAVIANIGKIAFFTTDRTLEKQEFDDNDSLRSPTYIFNLLERMGDKKCVLCDCEIPQLIHGAHIWPVASIKKTNHLTVDQKLGFAIDGNNGIWLCQNHHKLFDTNLLLISANGQIKYKSNLNQIHEDFILDVTSIRQIPTLIMTPTFLNFLTKRNSKLDERTYRLVV